jgi:putative addiction module component (TIGR02574 family)
MNHSFHEILTAAQALPVGERAQLLIALWEDAAPGDWIPPSVEWMNEVRRRSDAYDRGEIAADSCDAVRQRARKKAGLDG